MLPYTLITLAMYITNSAPSLAVHYAQVESGVATSALYLVTEPQIGIFIALFLVPKLSITKTTFCSRIIEGGY